VASFPDPDAQLISIITCRTIFMSGELIQNDTATAYGLGIIAIFLVVCTAVFLLISPVVNGFITEYNSQVDDGYVSEQRGDAMNFLMVVWKGVPIWAIFGLLAWGVVRALEQRSAEVG